jgi:hypothetical protein
MALAAEAVLKECEFALYCMEREDDRRKFKLFWMAALAGLRSVGHVLKNVDGPREPQIEKSAASAFARWKADREKHRIFWEFIEDERNALLKEARRGVLAIPYSIMVEKESHNVDFELYAPMIDGPYGGEDCRDVLKLAINWWKQELREIKRDAKT